MSAIHPLPPSPYTVSVHPNTKPEFTRLCSLLSKQAQRRVTKGEAVVRAVRVANRLLALGWTIGESGEVVPPRKFPVVEKEGPGDGKSKR